MARRARSKRSSRGKKGADKPARGAGRPPRASSRLPAGGCTARKTNTQAPISPGAADRLKPVQGLNHHAVTVVISQLGALDQPL